MYISAQDMIDAFSEDEIMQLTDPDGLGVIDDAVLNKALSFASASLDDAVSKSYAIPLVGELNEAAIGHLCAIALHKLYASQATDGVKELLTLAKKWLAVIASGRIVLLQADGGGFELPISGGSNIRSSSRKQVFIEDVMSQYDY